MEKSKLEKNKVAKNWVAKNFFTVSSAEKSKEINHAYLQLYR